MNRKHLIIFICVAFVAASFYFLPAKNKREQASEWTKNLPLFIRDSIYLDESNSFSDEKIELGRYLFFDRRLSINRSKSCATCHDPKFSFSDGYRRSVGAFGDLHQRNSTPLINIIYRKYLTAADSTLHYPEQQIANPLFHDQPVELGWKGNEDEMLKRIREDKFYHNRFKSVFANEAEPVSVKNIQYSIAAFVKTILSYDSPYDRFYYLKEEVLSTSAKKGMQLFFSNRLNCYKCHGGFDFATPVLKDSSGDIPYYFNTGLYNVDGKGGYPATDKGLMELTGKANDMGKYRVPTLRNLAFTAPYYHDGSAATLSEVIDNYIAGGRVTENGIAQGDGRLNPYKNKLINGFSIREEERKDLINFLLCLSDSSFATNKNYTNPFQDDETKK